MKMIKPNKLVKKSIVIFPVISVCLFFAVRAESRRLPKDINFNYFSVERTNCDEYEKYRDSWAREKGIEVRHNVRETICACDVDVRWRVAKSADAPRYRGWQPRDKALNFWPFVTFDGYRGYTLTNASVMEMLKGVELNRMYGFDPLDIQDEIEVGLTPGQWHDLKSDNNFKGDLPIRLYFENKACKVSEPSTNWGRNEIRAFRIGQCDRLTVRVDERRGIFYGYNVQALIFWGLLPAALLLAINSLLLITHYGSDLLSRIWNWTNK